MRLILPVAGQSSRFPGLRPKWLLTHPGGDLMIAASIRGLNLQHVDEIIVICLKAHYNEYDLDRVLKRQFDKLNLIDKLRIVQIDDSESQPHTVYQGLRKAKVDGPVLIKDADNHFEFTPVGGNVTCYVAMDDIKWVDPINKSYVVLDEQNAVVNIVEKQVISDTFCVGGYGFDEATDFARAFEKVHEFSNLYISHVIYQMILAGCPFVGERVRGYLDWGTLRQWNAYRSRFCTLFIDLDGTLVESSGEFFSPAWGESPAIEENVRIVNKLHDSGYAKIIIFTSRDPAYEEVTRLQLERIGLKHDQVIFGLFHSKRIIVNDYSKSNPYKSCEAINLRRDSSELVEMLEDALNIDDF